MDDLAAAPFHGLYELDDAEPDPQFCLQAIGDGGTPDRPEPRQAEAWSAAPPELI